MSVAHALGSIREPRAVKPLLAEFNNKAQGDYRYSLIKALGDIGDPRAIPALKKDAERRSANDTSGGPQRADRKVLEQIGKSQPGN
jgi:HEAT repeat protein